MYENAMLFCRRFLRMYLSADYKHTHHIFTITLPVFSPVITYAYALDISAKEYSRSITGLNRPCSRRVVMYGMVLFLLKGIGKITFLLDPKVSRG